VGFVKECVRVRFLSQASLCKDLSHAIVQSCTRYSVFNNFSFFPFTKTKHVRIILNPKKGMGYSKRAGSPGKVTLNF
jgi:hypothetical protein